MFNRFAHRLSQYSVPIAGFAAGVLVTLFLGLMGSVAYTGLGISETTTAHSDSFEF